MLNKQDRLQLNESLNVGDNLVSDDGRFKLFLENDAGLRLYGYRTDIGRRLLWALPPPQFTTPPQPNAECVFDLLGIRVEIPNGSAHPPVSLLHGFNGAQDLSNVYLVVQSDGNLVLYAAGGPQLGVLWASGTDLHSITTTPSQFVATERPIVEFASAGVVAVDGGGSLKNSSGVIIGVRDDKNYTTVANGDSISIAKVGTVSVEINTYSPPPTGPTPDSNPGKSGDAAPKQYQLQQVGFVLTVKPDFGLDLQ
jgi:hypothetical protein